MKNQVLHTVWCNIAGEAAGETWSWSLLGVKGLICEAPTVIHKTISFLCSGILGGTPLLKKSGSLILS